MNRKDYFAILRTDLNNDPRTDRLIEELNEHLDDHESMAALTGTSRETTEAVLGQSTIIANAHRTARRTANPTMIMLEAIGFGVAGTPIFLMTFIAMFTQLLGTLNALGSGSWNAYPALPESLAWVFAIGQSLIGYGLLCLGASIIFHLFTLRSVVTDHEQAQLQRARQWTIVGFPIAFSFLVSVGIVSPQALTAFDPATVIGFMLSIAIFLLGVLLALRIIRASIAAPSYSRFGKSILWYREKLYPKLSTIIGVYCTVSILVTHKLFLTLASLDRFNTVVDTHPVLALFIAAPRFAIELGMFFIHWWMSSAALHILHLNVTATYILIFGTVIFVSIVTPIMSAYRRYTLVHRLSIPWVAVISVVYFGGIAALAPLRESHITWHVPHNDIGETLERQELGPMYAVVKYFNRNEGWYANYYAYRFGDDLVVTMNSRTMRIGINDIQNPSITDIGDAERSHDSMLHDAPPANVSCDGVEFAYDGTNVYLGERHELTYPCHTLAVNGVTVAEIEDAQYAGMTMTADEKYAFLLLSTGIYDPTNGYLVELPPKE